MSDSNSTHSSSQLGQMDANSGKNPAPPTNCSNTEHQNYVNAYAMEQQRLAELRRQQGQGS